MFENDPSALSLPRASRRAFYSSSNFSSPASSTSHFVAPRGDSGEQGAKPDYSQAKIVVAMVGLPARGKSYLSNKLMRYLRVCRWQRLYVCTHEVCSGWSMT